MDARAKVTGEAKYAADIEMADMLWGAIKRSPYPHARILNIDTSKAERLPGVKAVTTGKDFGGFKWGWSRETRDEEPLATTKVRYLYEGVAAVAAIDEDIAEEACELIEVEYEPLPGVFDPFEAMKEGAPLVHEDRAWKYLCGVSLELWRCGEGLCGIVSCPGGYVSDPTDGQGIYRTTCHCGLLA